MSRSFRAFRSLALASAIVLGGIPAVGAAGEADKSATEKADKSASKRAKIDKHAKQSLDKLLKGSPQAKALHDIAWGYAVFDARKTSFAMAGGGGKGVAVAKASGERTYMKMASVGVNFGVGLKFYDLIFLFEDEKSFRGFVDNGWEAGAGANAVGGTEGANLAASFVNGMAIFEQSDKGLMLSADVSGTKYWQPKNLNEL
jgi:lipid-binding SYLF domain-containing protein